jgi:hypothetical protein
MRDFFRETVMGRQVVAFLLGFLERLRFPWLFGLVALLFVLDLFIPDIIPFADELLLGGSTILLGAWKKRRIARRGDRNNDSAQPDDIQVHIENDSAN